MPAFGPRFRAPVALGLLFASLATAPAAELHEQIDAAIAAKTAGPVAERSTDAEFLRRAYLSLSGAVPTTAEARAFLADKSAEKRAKLVDNLLARPEYARRMAEALTVMLLERRTGTKVADREWFEFLEKSLTANKPWDQLVREIVGSDGRDPETHAAVKFFVDGGRENLDQMTLDVARLFLGMNIQCAHCHDHPTVKDFKQADYYGLYSYLKQSRPLADPKTKKMMFIEDAQASKSEFTSVFIPDKKNATGPRLPGMQEIEIPTFAKGEELESPAKDGLPGIPKFRPRNMLANDLVSTTNERFVRNSVNRLWFLMMGRGIVHPLDMDHNDNPPSHPELLKLLAEDFVANKFDVKRLLREIALSEAYQRSSLLPEGVEAKDVKPESYRVSQPRTILPEQLVWSVLTATGNTKRLADEAPEGSKFVFNDYLNARIKDPPTNVPDTMQLFVAIFGSAPGEEEVEFSPGMGQALFLMNERLVLDWLKPHPGNLVERLSKIADPAPVAEELYLSVLSRPPVAEEQAEVKEYLEKNASRRDAALGELAWALIASAEFRLNH